MNIYTVYRPYRNLIRKFGLRSKPLLIRADEMSCGEGREKAVSERLLSNFIKGFLRRKILSYQISYYKARRI